MNKLSIAAIALCVLALTACKDGDSWFWDKHGPTSTLPGSPTLVFKSGDNSAILTIGIGSISGTAQTKSLYVISDGYFQRNYNKCTSLFQPYYSDGCHDQGVIVLNASSLTIPATSMGAVDAYLNEWRGAKCTPGRCSGSVTVRFDNHDPSGSITDWCNSETISWDESYNGTTNPYLKVDQQTDPTPCSALAIDPIGTPK